jgi:hypothetical protein
VVSYINITLKAKGDEYSVGNYFSLRYHLNKNKNYEKIKVLVWELGDKKLQLISKRFEVKMWLGGYETHEKPRLSTGGGSSMTRSRSRREQ